MTRPTFEFAFTARPEHIDELGHVNNAVWVQWIQQVAVAHWEAVAAPAHQDAFFWVIVRHEIDYLRPAVEGDRVVGRTWVGEAPKGARFDRHMEFTGNDGRPCVRARTFWAIIDKASGRPIRVPPPKWWRRSSNDFSLSYTARQCHRRIAMRNLLLTTWPLTFVIPLPRARARRVTAFGALRA